MITCPSCDAAMSSKECSKCGWSTPKVNKNSPYTLFADILRASEKGHMSNPKSEYVIQAREILKKALCGSLTGFDLSCEMFEMHKKYPGNGWDEAAKEVLHKFNLAKKIETSPELMPKKRNFYLENLLTKI